MRMIPFCLACLVAGSVSNPLSAQDTTRVPRAVMPPPRAGSTSESTTAPMPGSTPDALSPSPASTTVAGYKLAGGIRFSSGSPTLSNSLSFKYFFNEDHAIEGLVSFGDRFGFGALYEKHQLIGATPAFTWFYGAGGYAGFQDGKTWLGPTGVVGLDYKFPNAPLNLSLDWKPELDISPAINFVPDAFALTARFTFF